MVIYKGEYLNNERTGKGKEYNVCGNLRFKGEYIKGKKWNGEEYYDNGNLRFKGEYINGKKWNGKEYPYMSDSISYELKGGDGFLTEYNEYGDIIFEGQYLNGERNGIGKEYIHNELKFEGEYLNGKRWNGVFYNKGNKSEYILKEGKGIVK